MKKRFDYSQILFCILVVPVFILLTTGCSTEQNAESPPARPVPVVSFLTITPQKTVLTTELPGRTSAFRLAQIRPQVNGLIQERLFEEGSDVKAGQVLYQIEPDSFKAAADSARARLGAARKMLDRLASAMDMSRAGILMQEASLELAQLNADRYKKLAKSNSVSAVQLDQAVTELKIADASLKTAHAQLESDREALEAARADIKQAEAAFKTAEINLRYCRVTAPISGRIGKSTVTEGAVVTAYQGGALATIQQLDPVYVDVPQSSTEMLRLKRSILAGEIHADEKNPNSVHLTLEDGTAYPHEGALKFSDVTVDPTTGSVTLRIVFPNPEGLLLPGMFVRARVKEGINDQAILVPQQGVTRNHKGNPMALVVTTENTVEFRSLVLDRAIENQWLVSSGLKAGDRLIVEGLQMLRPGMSVKAKPFVASGAGTQSQSGQDNPPHSTEDGGA